jgi:hypothetical protein
MSDLSRYRLTGQILAILTESGSYKNCATVPAKCKTLSAAVAWYERPRTKNDRYYYDVKCLGIKT